MSSKKLVHFLILASALVLAGCGISDALKKRARMMDLEIKNMHQLVLNRESQFADFQKSEEWTFLKSYAQKENWQKFFDDSLSEVKRARSIYNTTVRPILKKDNTDDEGRLRKELNNLDRILRGLAKSSQAAFARIDFLKKVKKEAPILTKKARDQVKEVNSIHLNLQNFVNKAVVDYPKRKPDIISVFAPAGKLKNDSNGFLILLNEQFSLHEKGQEAQYDVLGDKSLKIEEKLKVMKNSDKNIRKKIGELYRNYSKILVDMKVGYTITVGRTSWDNFYDWPTEHTYTYRPVEVDANTLKYISNIGERTIASYGGWSSVSVRIDKGMWNKLHVNAKQSWSSGDDEAEFWISNWNSIYYHKYAIFENDKKTETDWIVVNEDLYEDNLEALGMEIVSKPYGIFESEKMKEPVPAGINMVGNSRYGEWRTNSSGRSFWHYYGQYAFFSHLMGGNSYYYRSDYDHYRTWRGGYAHGNGGYYGTNSQKPSYGTYSDGVKKSARWQSSHFSKSGGLKTARSSFRSGSSRRGRGPGGGGK